MWQRHEKFFRRPHISKIYSVSEPTRMQTLLIWPSFHLNKFSTRLKNNFRETAYPYFYGREFDNDMSIFFVAHSDQKLFLFLNLLVYIHSYSSPSFYLNKSLTRLKNTFRETAYRHFFERKIWQRQDYFFLDDPDRKFFLFQNLLRFIHSYYSPYSIWTSPWLD